MGGTEVALRPEVSGTCTSGGKCFKQCRLARTVGPCQQDAFARSHLEGYVPDQGAVAVADGYVIDLKHVADGEEGQG